MRRLACSILLLGLATVGNTAHAADLSAEQAPWYLHPLGAVGTAIGSAWTSVGGLFGGTDPYDYLPNQVSDDDRRFIATLDAMGLQLAEVKVGGGTFSHSSYRFVAAREASDVDILRAERKLDEYRAVGSGLRSGAKQRILRSVLDVASDKVFILTAVNVELWPWPSVDYEMTARNRPPEAAERRVIEATQQQ
jgi:hypothetical protein